MIGVIRGAKPRPRRILLYGTHGIGKSTWAGNAPSRFFLVTEEGAEDLDVDRTPLLRSEADVHGWISRLLNEDHDYKTVVLDTIDWFERLVFNQVAVEKGKTSIEDIGYAKGYVYALSHWERLLNALDALRQTRNMAVILLAHARVVKIEPPGMDAYTKYEPDVDKRATPVLQEWADEVLFATYKVDVSTRGEGFEKRAIAIGTGLRRLYTRETASYAAKRRIPLPDEMNLDFAEYAGHVRAAYANFKPAAEPPAGNIAGIVNNGSSKPAVDTNVPFEQTDTFKQADELFCGKEDA